MRPQVGCGWSYIRDCIDRAPLPNREPCRSNAELLRSVARGSSGAWLRGSPKNAGGEARIRFASVLRLCRCSNRDGLRALSGAASVGLLRSMRCGKPVISCDGGVRETEAYGGVRRQQYLFGGRHWFMEYVDSLALSVKNKKMTEAEAMRRYTEYKSGGVSACTQAGGAAKC